MDRIQTIYSAIDQITSSHGKGRPDRFGGGVWDFNEEIKIWKSQILGQEEAHGYIPLSTLQWIVIEGYIENKRREVYGEEGRVKEEEED